MKYLGYLLLFVLLVIPWRASTADPTKQLSPVSESGVFGHVYDSLGGPACVLRQPSRELYLVFPDEAAEQAALALRGSKVTVEGLFCVRWGRPWFYVFRVRQWQRAVEPIRP